MNQSRRQFVQVMAFVGAAMATPKLVKAADLPEPQLVHVLPESDFIKPTNEMIWIDGKPLTTGYQFQINHQSNFSPIFSVRDEYPSFAIPPKPTVEFRLVCCAEDMTKFYDGKNEKPVEIIIIPSATGDVGYCAKGAILEDMESRFDSAGGNINTVVSATWRAAQLNVEAIPSLMKRVGVTKHSTMLKVVNG